jgi:restriction endonuclease S subunit
VIGHSFAASPLVPTTSAHNGWRWHRLTELAKLATGHTPSRRHPEYWDGDIPWIQLPDIRALDGQTATGTSECINDLGIQNSAAVLLPAGTVCLSRTASVGFVTIMGRPMATSQDFVNWVCGPDLDPQFLMYLLLANRQGIRDLGSGAVHHTVYFPTVESFSVCIPEIDEQRRIGSQLAEQLASADAARRLASERVAIAEALTKGYFRSAFENGARTWTTERLGALCSLLPSKSLSTKGDTEVLAITTACLSENGFQQSGLKTARMHAGDVQHCIVSPGEILVARSNTPELVGRASIYRGFPPSVVASDLTIRLWPNGRVSGEYIGAYLSYLFLTGHWRQRSGGASGTMKKITREQLIAQSITIPGGPSSADVLVSDLLCRVKGAGALVDRCRAELSAIMLLPSALLRAAFNWGI